jgi:hypothetical protein
MEEEKGRERIGIPAEDIEEAVDKILLKKTRGEELDRRDWLILGYHHFAPKCHHPKH